jgi:hypothetical protein
MFSIHSDFINTYFKFYINVPFSKKDIAKANGAKWDSIKKLWYIICKKLQNIFMKYIYI